MSDRIRDTGKHIVSGRQLAGLMSYHTTAEKSGLRPRPVLDEVRDQKQAGSPKPPAAEMPGRAPRELGVAEAASDPDASERTPSDWVERKLANTVQSGTVEVVNGIREASSLLETIPPGRPPTPPPVPGTPDLEEISLDDEPSLHDVDLGTLASPSQGRGLLWLVVGLCVVAAVGIAATGIVLFSAESGVSAATLPSTGPAVTLSSSSPRVIQMAVVPAAVDNEAKLDEEPKKKLTRAERRKIARKKRLQRKRAKKRRAARAKRARGVSGSKGKQKRKKKRRNRRNRR